MRHVKAILLLLLVLILLIIASYMDTTTYKSDTSVQDVQAQAIINKESRVK